MKNYLHEMYDLNDARVISLLDELPLWSAPFGMRLLDMVHLKKNIRALDVGFGTGFPLIELAERLGKTCEVVGIDPCISTYDRINAKIKMFGLTNVTLDNHNAERMQFENESFDLIVSNNGINNVTNPDKALYECYRVAKHGAQFVMTVNLPDTMKEFYSAFKDALTDLGLHEEIKKLDAHIFEKRKPLDVTEKMITDSGFKIDRKIEDEFYMRFSDCTTFFNHHVIKMAFRDSWKKILKEYDIENVFDLIETKLNAVAEKNGELRLTIPFVCIDCRKE